MPELGFPRLLCLPRDRVDTSTSFKSLAESHSQGRASAPEPERGQISASTFRAAGSSTTSNLSEPQFPHLQNGSGETNLHSHRDFGAWTQSSFPSALMWLKRHAFISAGLQPHICKKCGSSCSL